MKNFEKLKKILSKKDINSIFIILLLSVVSTFLEILSIGILVPFLSNLDEGFEFKNDFLIQLNQFYEIYLSKDVLLILIIIISLFLIKNFIYLLARYIEQRFIYRFHRNITKKLFNYYLNKDLNFHNQNNSANLIKNITAECNILSFNLLQPLILSISELIVLSFLISFLFFVNFYATVSIILFLIFISILFSLTSKGYLRRLGVKRHKHSGLSLKELQQALSSIREISIYKVQNYFVEKFDLHNKINLETGYKSKFLYSVPKSLIEISVIVGILSITYFLKINGFNFTEIVIIISIYILAAAKIMPGVIRIFSVLVNINYTKNSLKVFDNNFFRFNYQKNKDDIYKFKKKLSISKIELKNLNFRYGKKLILKNINLKLNSTDKIGIVGSSGSGKTTLINIIVGLIKQYNGKYLINGKRANDLMHLFQNSIGYVPQNSLTIDETIKENILLGRELKNKKFYNKILKDLDLNTLNMTKSKSSFKEIGERGSRVSGGQNQRIGLARALYNTPPMIILDEALNSIDEKLKKKIVYKLFKEYPNDLIIIVTHNKEDIKLCKKKFELKNGVLNKI